jgi:arginyl-tRNA synthetase
MFFAKHSEPIFIHNANKYTFCFMNILSIIQNGIAQGVQTLYNQPVAPENVPCSVTKKEFEGDFTVTLFAWAKLARKSPVQIGQDLGAYLLQNVPAITRFNVIQGFLNVTVSDSYWIDFLAQINQNPQFGQARQRQERVMIEFSSPNTNKPLHLGHVRNILLGWSTSKILAAAGYEVIKTQVINDRGIAICKSMLAWQKYGEGKTPESTGIKSDRFVGDYYVRFDKELSKKYKIWQETPHAIEIFENRTKKELDKDAFFKEYKNTYFNENSKLGVTARQMLLDWEAGKPEIMALWQKMNQWVYDGFNQTYNKLGVHFDKNYYESNTYMLGKDTIEKGIDQNIFYRKPDSSVWIDLTDVKLDHKVVLRSDGTSVYITQDIGMARLRDQEFGAKKVIYVVADEQNYHFQVLFAILKKLNEPYANGLHHLSYGMVDLPSGKMKSREGTVVDADDLIAEVIQEAYQNSVESGEIAAYSESDKKEIYRKLGLGALKYQLVKVHPKKRMIFDPKESVQVIGQTGPYIQYSYVRISSVAARAILEGIDLNQKADYLELKPAEKDLILKMHDYPTIILEAAQEYDPSVVAGFAYDLAKLYHKFWHDLQILKAETEGAKIFRLQLSKAVAQVLKHSFELLGIEMPERM